jgi:hypothetical protein
MPGSERNGSMKDTGPGPQHRFGAGGAGIGKPRFLRQTAWKIDRGRALHRLIGLPSPSERIREQRKSLDRRLRINARAYDEYPGSAGDGAAPRNGCADDHEPHGREQDCHGDAGDAHHAHGCARARRHRAGARARGAR